MPMALPSHLCLGTSLLMLPNSHHLEGPLLPQPREPFLQESMVLPSSPLVPLWGGAGSPDSVHTCRRALGQQCFCPESDTATHRQHPQLLPCTSLEELKTSPQAWLRVRLSSISLTSLSLHYFPSPHQKTPSFYTSQSQ